ncbi:hypothetical protein [Brucella cytisi]|uniref:hypothetical protein n=1 Tax=Brucella cytisi TaxID=407152 RepID=UPI00313B2D64
MSVFLSRLFYDLPGSGYPVEKSSADTLPKTRACSQEIMLGMVCETKTAETLSRSKREETCDAFPGVDWSKIQSAARYYNYRRKKKPYKVTGVLSLDQCRSRCYEINWIMRDLDDEAGTGRYFQTRGYRCNYPNFKAISRGCEPWAGDWKYDGKNGSVSYHSVSLSGQ